MLFSSSVLIISWLSGEAAHWSTAAAPRACDWSNPKKNVLWLILGPAHAEHRGAFLKDWLFKKKTINKKKQEKAELRHDSQHFLSRKKKKQN